MPIFGLNNLLFPEGYLTYRADPGKKVHPDARPITADELSAFREVFLLYDKNGDGTITKVCAARTSLLTSLAIVFRTLNIIGEVSI